MKALTMFALAFAAFSTFAAEPDYSPAALCKERAEIAGSVMNARQNGQEMVDLMDLVDKHFDEIYRDPFVQMVVLAYDSPRYSSEEYKSKAVSDFKNTTYLTCFKARAR